MHNENANVFADLENIVVILTFVNDALSGFNGWLDDTKNNLGGWAPVVKAAFDSVANAIFPLKLLLQGVADLIRFISGTKSVGGVATNFSTSTDYSHMTPFATGGIVTGPTPALVGEAGPEAIIPLDRLNSIMASRGGMGGGATVNISVNAGMGADGAAIGEQIVTAIRKYERTSGRVFAAA
jgi:phage-related minor tail protein